MAIKQIYHLNFLTGGIDSTYLDYADGNSLSEGDRAYVIYADTYYVYRLDATSGAAESSPNIIAPDTNAGTKRWILVTSYSLTSVTTSVTAADNTSSTAIATTAYAKSQDAVLAREPDQGVALTAAASGSSGITVADNDNIDFGTGNFFLCWKGSLPDWTPSGNVILVNKRQDDDNRYQIYLSSATKLVYLHAKTGGTTVTKTTTNAISLVDNSTHEIHAVITRETASVAGSVSFYMDGVLFETLAITASAPADLNNTGSLVLMGYADSRYAGTVHHAYLGNFDPTAVEVLDMYRNGIPEWAKWGSQTSLITGDNSTFASDTGWWGKSGNATISGGHGNFSAAGSDSDRITKEGLTVVGKRYRVVYDLVSISSGGIRVGGSGYYESSRTSAANGCTVEFTADNTMFAFYSVGTSNAVFDNVSLVEIGLTAAYLPENIQPDKWYDASSNALHASYPTSGWSLTRPTVLRASSLPALTAFVGTVSVSGTTVTFSSASDCALCNVGSTIVAGGDTRYITKLTNSTTLVIDQTASWSSTAITSIQAPQFVSGSNGTTRTFVAASGSVTTVLVSDGSILEHLTVDGKRGIGTTGPSQLLHIQGTGSPTLFVDSTSTTGTRQARLKLNIASSGASDPAGEISFNANAVEQARIDSLTGGTGTGDGILRFFTRNAGTVTEQARITNQGNFGLGKTTPNYQLELSTDSAGKPGAGGLWTVVSDERLKTNIELADLDRCYEIIKSIPLKRFAWADGVYTEEQVKDRHNLGWIAQDVEKVFAKAVNVKPFTKAELIPDGFEEYEEQDFIIEEVEKEEISIEVKDGKAVQVKKIVKKENKVMLFEALEVFDEDGNLVIDTEGIPLTHQAPRMVKKTREKFRQEIIEDCLDLNSGQLIAAMYGCIQLLQAKVEVLEKRSRGK